jgi:hypothetical protein
MPQSVTFPSKAGLINDADDANAALKIIERLERLAAWHRLSAEHAGSAWVWEARLRTAEALERQAVQLQERCQLRRNPAVAAN